MARTCNLSLTKAANNKPLHSVSKNIREFAKYHDLSRNLLTNLPVYFPIPSPTYLLINGYTLGPFRKRGPPNTAHLPTCTPPYIHLIRMLGNSQNIMNIKDQLIYLISQKRIIQICAHLQACRQAFKQASEQASKQALKQIGEAER